MSGHAAGTAAVLVAVGGATGRIGGGVARRLAERGVAQRLVVRDPTRAPSLAEAVVVQAEYGDARALRAALDGVDTFLFVSASETADRQRIHRTVVDCAVEAAVRRVVYVSFLGAAPDCTFTFARDHWHTEQAIRDTGVAFTFLRDSLYQDVLPYFVGQDDVLRGPAADGRFAPVTRDDVADVAAAVLLDEAGRHDGQTYDVTGPRLMTMHDVAEHLAAATGRPVRYHAETVAEAYESRAAFGAPRWQVDGWVTTYSAIANGELAVVSDTVPRLAGHPAVDFVDFLRQRSLRRRHG